MRQGHLDWIQQADDRDPVKSWSNYFFFSFSHFSQISLSADSQKRDHVDNNDYSYRQGQELGQLNAVSEKNHLCCLLTVFQPAWQCGESIVYARIIWWMCLSPSWNSSHRRFGQETAGQSLFVQGNKGKWVTMNQFWLVQGKPYRHYNKLKLEKMIM